MTRSWVPRETVYVEAEDIRSAVHAVYPDREIETIHPYRVSSEYGSPAGANFFSFKLKGDAPYWERMGDVCRYVGNPTFKGTDGDYVCRIQEWADCEESPESFK